MSFKKEAHRMLGSSVALLPPGDLLDDSQCQNLQNFRVDQAGVLRSRLGSTVITSSLGIITSVIKALGARYVGGGTSLFRTGSSILSGCDGSPLGFVDWKKWLWVMNRTSGKQQKDDGTNIRLWNIVAPVTKCAATTGSEYAKTVTAFDSGETWVVSPSGADSFDGSEKQEGTASLSIVATAEETYIATRTVSLDLSSYSGHTADDQDKHRIWIYANKFKKLDSIMLQVDVSNGLFNAEFYSVEIPRKYLKKTARKGWFRFEVRRSKPTVADKVPFFERIGGDTTKNWSTVAAVRVVVDTRAAATVKLDLWDVFGSIDALIEGEDIQYYFTYVNTDGHESNPAPVSDKATINRTGVALSSLTASADGQVTGKHIYRSGGTLTFPWRVTATAVANATTTYTDVMSDFQAVQLGIPLEVDNDAPPLARGIVGPYLGRIVAYSSASFPARFWWSKLNKPWAFPGAADAIGQFADAGATSEAIVGATMRTRLILFYKENSIWRCVGDPQDVDGELEVTRSKVGAVSHNAIVEAGSVDYFESKDGIYTFNGDTEKKISVMLDPIFKGQTTTLASGVTILPVNASSRGTSAMGYRNGRLYFSYCTGSNTAPDKTLTYDEATQRWATDSRGFGAYWDEGTSGNLIAGNGAGVLSNLETGNDDASSGIVLDFFSKYYDVGSPDNEKTFEDFTLDIDTGSQALTVTAYFNDGASNVVLSSVTTVNTAARTRLVLPTTAGATGTLARNIAIRIQGTVTSPVIVYDAYSNYYTEARQAKSFDSDEIAFGQGKVSLLRELKLDVLNAATITINVLSDQPGFAMASRDATETISTGSTRRVEPVVFASDIKGSLHRVVCSGTDFKLYSAQALVKVFGTYLFGTKGEFYNSDPLDFGSERVKLVKEIEIDCDIQTATTVGLTLSTDLPGTAGLASRHTTTLSATTGEQTIKVVCPGTVQGRLVKLGLIPTGDFIIYAIRMWVKTIGEPAASPWTWVPLPLEPTTDGIWMPIPIGVDE